MSHGIDRKMSPGAAADSEEFPTRRSFLNVSEILRSFAFKERTLAFQEQPLAFKEQPLAFKEQPLRSFRKTFCQVN